jgi:hypothetical protein
LAGVELALLVSDSKPEGAAQHDPELLVVMAVLRKLCTGLDLDDGQRDPLAIHRTRDQPIPDRPWLDRCEIVECAHRGGDPTGLLGSCSDAR